MRPLKRNRPAVVAVIVLLLFGSAHSLLSQPSQLQANLRPLLWGADLTVSFPVADVEHAPIATLGAGGAWRSVGYYRIPDGSLLTADNAPELLDDYSELQREAMALWRIGVIQPIASTDEGQLEAFLRYDGQLSHGLDDREELLAVAAEQDHPDAEGVFLNQLLTGASYYAIRIDSVTTARSGADAELTVSWAPRGLANEVRGDTDATRLTVSARTFQRLYTAEPRDEMNVFTLYGAAHAIADYAFGERIPLEMRRTFGGRWPRSGLGGTVRGYESGRYDSSFKVAGNAELRAVLPAVLRPDLLPGAVAYFDAGYYSGLPNAPDGPEQSGLLASTGLGLSVSLFDLATFVFYSHVALTEQTIDGTRWTPFAIGFGYHF